MQRLFSTVICPKQAGKDHARLAVIANEVGNVASRTPRFAMTR